MKNINQELKTYIDKNILPQYDTNIGGHGIDHINYVIERSFELMKSFNLDINPNMVYTIAAFHDIGYKINPDEHEEYQVKCFYRIKKSTIFLQKKKLK